MFCKHCGKEIADNSEFCQFCGTKQNEERIKGTPNIQDNKENNNGCLMSLLGFVIIFIFFVLIISADSTPFEEDQQAQESLARVLCEQRVKDSLKYPPSAEFPNRSGINFTRIDNMKYKIDSYVYGTNSFGGKIRNDYSCTVYLDNEDTGRIVNLRIE